MNAILTAETLSSESFIQDVVATDSFFTGLNSSVFSELPIDILNYGNAWPLYDFALFQVS